MFGFKATYALSTRPKKAIGSKELWDNAEAQLKDVLQETGLKWTLNPGDGAFYGPKIDIRLEDTMRRKHQCGTIQLDFNAPIRFNLQYQSESAPDTAEEKEPKSEFQGAVEKNKEGDIIWKEGKLKTGYERPVVIHRAILGSVERMSAILMEHFNGKWPFWLSPRQVMIVPVALAYNNYALWLVRQLTLFGFYADADVSGNTLNKKVRTAQTNQWNYTCVVGEKEKDNLSVTVRQRDVERPIGTFGVKQFMLKLQAEALPTSQPINRFESFEGSSLELDDAPASAASASTAPVVSSVPVTSSAKPEEKSRAKSTLPAQKSSANPSKSAVPTVGLESALGDQPYINGFLPTKADLELFNKLRKESELPVTPNLKR